MGQIAPKTKRRRKRIWQDWADWLVAEIDGRPNIYLHELQAALKLERRVVVSLQKICNACQAVERRRKKRL